MVRVKGARCLQSHHSKTAKTSKHPCPSSASLLVIILSHRVPYPRNHGLNSIFQLLDVRRWRHAPGSDVTPASRQFFSGDTVTHVIRCPSKSSKIRATYTDHRHVDSKCAPMHSSWRCAGSWKTIWNSCVSPRTQKFQFVSQSQSPKTKHMAHWCTLCPSHMSSSQIRHDFFSSTEIRVPAINISSDCKSSKRWKTKRKKEDTFWKRVPRERSRFEKR